MDVWNAILTAPMRPAGELLLFRPIIVFGSSVAQLLAIHTAELTGYAEAIRRISVFIPRGERVRILYD